MSTADAMVYSATPHGLMRLMLPVIFGESARHAWTSVFPAAQLATRATRCFALSRQPGKATVGDLVETCGLAFMTAQDQDHTAV